MRDGEISPKRTKSGDTLKACGPYRSPFNLQQGAWTLGGIGLGGVASQVMRVGVEASKAGSMVVP
jgi:hypothetical protein